MLKDLLLRKNKIEKEIKSLLIGGFNVQAMINLKSELEEIHNQIRNTKEIEYQDDALKLIKIIRDSDKFEEEYNLVKTVSIELDFIVKKKLVSVTV